MKKIYYLASGLLLASSAVAQVTVPYQRSMTAASQHEVHTGFVQDRAAGDVISTYEDDFSVPANWSLANTGSPLHNFTISAAGPASAPELLASTSGGNMAWYDCDPQGDGSTVDATLTYASTFDLSANPYVMVSFEQFYMDYYEDTYVEVSTNGLAGPWTQYEVNGDYLPNSYSDVNPVQTLVNISTQAGGQANVAVRFHYVGGWGWSWQIDDFALVEAYQNDLTINGARFSSGTEANEYFIIPTHQLTEITFGARIKSNGVVTQTNSYLHVEIDGGTEYDEVSSTVNLAENVTDTFSIETPNGWTPSGVGIYDVDMTAITDDYTDELIADNVTSHEVEVGGAVYARDNGIISGGFSGFTSTAGEPLQIGNIFEFFNPTPQVFGKVLIGITSSADSEGQLAFASVYRWDGVDFVLETQSGDYTIQAGDLGTIIEFPLDDNVTVNNGDILLICAGHYGGDPTVSFAEAQGTRTGSVLAMSVGGLVQGADPSAVIVRALFEPSDVNVAEITPATMFTAYPNPANTMVTVCYNLVNGGAVSLTMTDATGKLVMAEDFGTQAEGEYKTTLNTASLENGVYFYTINVDGMTITKKLTISGN
jgi:hypothetical protein